jgi:mono/diheme cytochrome c family protein
MLMSQTKTALAGIILALMAGTASAQNAPVSYMKDVKPLLTKYCADCHGANQAKAGYKVDTFDALSQAGKKGTLVVASKPDQSLLMKVLNGQGAKIMPPRTAKAKPTAAEIAKIKSWIMAGAKDDTAAALLDPLPELPARLVALIEGPATFSYISPHDGE